MATQPKGKTRVNFLARNERAEAIAAVASAYPEDEINANITPLRDREEGERAFSRAFPDKDLKKPGYGAHDMDAVLERYGNVGATGLFSLVTLDVPKGGQRFDFPAFYERVDQLQGDRTQPN